MMLYCHDGPSFGDIPDTKRTNYSIKETFTKRFFNFLDIHYEKFIKSDYDKLFVMAASFPGTFATLKECIF